MKSLYLAIIFITGITTSLSAYAEPQSVTLDIQSMRCQASSAAVRNSLEHIPGVTAVHTNPDGRTATVQTNGSISSETLTAATASAGYASTVKTDPQ